MNGFWKLTWVETKVFIREPMGFVTSLAMPLVIFLVFGSLTFGSSETTSTVEAPFNVPILAALFIALSG